MCAYADMSVDIYIHTLLAFMGVTLICMSYMILLYMCMWYVIYDTTIHVYVDTLLAFMGLNLFSIPLFNCLKFT